MEIVETQTQKIKRIYLSVHSGEHILSTDESSPGTDNKDQMRIHRTDLKNREDIQVV